MLIPEEVQTFLAIHRCGSLAEAARSVHASQSTISYRLHVLEKRLGERLVERARGAHQINLTPAGDRYLLVAEKWESLLQEAERIHAARSQSLAIGAASAINVFLLGELYTRLGAWQPPLHLTIESVAGPQLCDQVALGHLDVAFVFYARRHVDLVVTPFASSPLVVVRAAGSELLDGSEPVRVETLPRHREVYLRWGPDFDLWRQQVLPSGVSLRVNRADMLAPLMRVPETWALAPMFVARALADQTGCTVHQVADPPPDKVVYQVRNRRSRPSVKKALSILTTCVTEVGDRMAADLLVP